MKTYCKRKDVSDVAFVKESISEFLLDRLDKSNVAKLFAYYNGISNTKSRKCINDSKEFVEGTIECIAADISENIRNRTVVDHILLVTPNGVNQLVQDAIRNQQSQRYDQYSGESPG